jgi:hypothetical protein
VVVRYGDRLIKGAAGVDGLPSIEAFMRGAHRAGDSIEIRMASGDTESIAADGVKAVFLVRSFEGDSTRKDLHFHALMPVSKGVWVRLRFDDGELMEGIVLNTGAFVLEPGFCLIPTDPLGNNRLAYVPKARLRSVEVLGLRNPPNGHANF